MILQDFRKVIELLEEDNWKTLSNDYNLNGFKVYLLNDLKYLSLHYTAVFDSFEVDFNEQVIYGFISTRKIMLFIFWGGE